MSSSAWTEWSRYNNVEYYEPYRYRAMRPPAIRWMIDRMQTYWPDLYAHMSWRWTEAESGTDVTLDGEDNYDRCSLPCGWVTPHGRWIGVYYGEHWDALQYYVGRGCDYSDAESRGWIHAGGQGQRDCPRYDGKRITPAQRRKLEDYGYDPD